MKGKLLSNFGGILTIIILALGIQKPIIASSTTKSVDEVKLERDEVLSKIKEVESQAEKLQDEINRLQAEIDNMEDKKYILKKEKDVLEGEIIEAQEDKQEKYEIMSKMIRVNYEQKSVGLLEILLQSENFTSFLRRVEILNQLIKNNNYLLEEIKSIEASLQEKSIILENKIKEIEENSKIQKEAMDNFNNKVNEREIEKRSLIKLQKELEEEVDSIQSKLANSSNNESYSGGQMSWPVPGYSYISSYYGNRTHPISGQTSYHKGIDIPAPEGSMVIAANEGVVVTAGYNTSYGNLVAIDHGGGIISYYAHNNSLLVSVGQKVSKGENIATVGTTGYSTGNHLHFEVQVNGSFVDPMNYLK